MAEPSEWPEQARRLMGAAREPAGARIAVIRFHRTVDEVIDASRRGHAVEVACRRGCHWCCNMPVMVQAHEAFALADWLREHFTPAALEAVRKKARDNAERTRALGFEARSRTNLPCSLLGPEGECSAYEARPAQCRKFHSVSLETCRASFAHPEDDSILTPEHAAVAHNASVIITQARNAAQAAGFDANVYDLNIALVEALDNPKARRRWRDGKKAFVGDYRIAG